VDEFNFAIAAFAVVIGLGATDMANSLHRLLTAAVPIRWSPLPLASAAYIGLVLSSIWFHLWLLRRLAEFLDYWLLTALLAQALLVYLAAAAALPDHVERDSDLAAHYGRRRRNIWIPMALFSASTLATSLYFSTIVPSYPIGLSDWGWRIAPLPVYLMLAFTRSTRLSWLGLVVLTGLLARGAIDGAP
jgi:hypothetical protein